MSVSILNTCFKTLVTLKGSVSFSAQEIILLTQFALKYAGIDMKNVTRR